MINPPDKSESQNQANENPVDSMFTRDALDRMRAHGILIDGEGVVNGGTTKILLQVFSRTMVGPIFFEFIQRKGDEGFGEGNFQALFESIERADVA